MNKYMIRGGRELFGEVTVSGAKNAAVAIIPAALLVDGVCRIENIPQISDVTLFFSILEELGAKVRVLNQHAIEIDCHAIHSTRPSYDLARRIRASYYLLGALLGRFGQATVAMPGGCNFGVRPIDQHIKGFTTMGAEVSVEGGFIHTAAKNGRLVGAPVYLDVVSVGATINIMLAAVAAEGQTIIANAAKEPHVVDLAKGHVAACAFAAEHTGCEIINLGTGVGYSVLDIVKNFEAATGVKIPYVIKPRRAGDIATCYSDASKAERELGWKAENGIKEMCADSWRWQSNNPNGYEE